MKKNLILGLVLALLSSCSEKDVCMETLEAKQLDCINAKHKLQINLIDDYTLIKDNSSYDDLVSGTCHPSIDFNQYDLLIGKKSSGNSNDTIIYNLERNCTNNRLLLSIDVVQSDATMPDNVVYHVLLPKLDDQANLEVKITLL